ncbi:rhamnosidase, partial [Streptomyces sp. SID7982]|nr:rhamnosidase [Streptomyces sp. SID7982]
MISRRRLLSTTATALGTTLIAGAIPPAQAAERGAPGAKGLRVGGSTAEYVRNPLGLGAARPRLGWPLTATAPGRTQSAYQIRVALSERALERPDVWDSGKVESADSTQVLYGGPELRSRTRYY